MALGRKAKVGMARKQQATTTRRKDVVTRIMAVGLWVVCLCNCNCEFAGGSVGGGRRFLLH